MSKEENHSEWLGNMGREANRQQSEEIAERIKQMNAEKQRKKQEELKKAQEEKRRIEEKKKKEEERRRLFYLKT
ncbi:hypothetical protein EG346_02090 [Chryseobacterium carnipullorum]|uniref:Uncharacterized protein n=1 Tax=Chryseobacterium carnipullorum TaxID=1124835 RepID=A0A3G6LUY4_CHRCU|nr:hypothetical protein [Chryseobacterium carnipullorum]AZA47060.1 hypothetical protein EG346_02090 [Chryseobacterium carnipullorum]